MSTSQESLRLVGAGESPTLVPWVMTLDDADSTRDVIDALALSPFASGAQPHARGRRLEHVRADAPLRPADSKVVRSCEDQGTEAALAVGDGWTLRIIRWDGGSAALEVTAVTDELAVAVLAESVDGATKEPEQLTDQVDMGFWHLSGHGPQRRQRQISAASWAEIDGNYAGDVRPAMERLMALTAESISGRLLLLHGPPGTGKTTALRALAREWSSWCQFDCVLDPDALFGSPGYLMEVAVGATGGEGRWRLLILEDCDELIRGEAKSSAGQGLSRLLNLTDGMLGQGRDVLVAVTTNEPLTALHPAVVRPGRCLAQLEVGRLSPADARAWAAREMPDTRLDIPADGLTLAELVAARTGDDHITTEPRLTTNTGFYL